MEEHSPLNSLQGKIVRITKRLNHAIGYYELGMARQAIECIDSLAELGDLGPFLAVAELIKAEALKLAHRFDDAATSLEAAAKALPGPAGQSVWLALSYCYSQAGDSVRAVNSLACARVAKPPTSGEL